MSYLKDFLTQIKNRDFHKFLVLWEEYATSDTVETEEFSQLLKAIKASDLAPHFGKIIETALPLWQTIDDPEESYEILKLLIDLQNTNSPKLAEITLNALTKKYGNDSKFNERLRLIGMRNKDQFQGALSKYDLCVHMNKGNIVFHTGGWGTGEIIEVSHVREHLVIEFENVSGRKDLSFTNAFKTLIPLANAHFLARRFVNPDLLEKEGRMDPISLIQLLLHDVGPLTAAEIKDELCELVILESEWTKWWQSARTKMKKHPLIETPDSLKECFYLRKAELSPEERLKEAMHNKIEVDEVIQTTYNFVRDTPGALKNPSTREKLQEKLLKHLDSDSLKNEHRLQIFLLLEQFFNHENADQSIKEIILSLKPEQLEEMVLAIEILAFKKQVLLAIKEYRQDWVALFLMLLFTIPPAQLRDYIFRELNQVNTRSKLDEKLTELLHNPAEYPEMYVWYFQKLISSNDKSIPFQEEEGKRRFFEAFFILLSAIEGKPEYRELVKKMYAMISGKRYELIRQLLQGTSLEFAKEFLLLISKCQSLSDHDLKILRSLVEVVHPTLAQVKNKKGEAKIDSDEIWTTEEGYLKIQERIRQIGTVEVVENAREIEAARALGDLRENSEYKFAQERRARLQSELKTLSDDLNRARILTPNDIHINEVGVGNVVDLEDSQGKNIRYLILGPWDANPDKNILSYNSKFALEMSGKRRNETFQFRDVTYKILDIGSYFNK